MLGGHTGEFELIGHDYRKPSQLLFFLIIYVWSCWVFLAVWTFLQLQWMGLLIVWAAL